jgi:hypothetical protein
MAWLAARVGPAARRRVGNAGGEWRPERPERP